MDYDFNIFYYIDMYKKWWKKIVVTAVVSMFLVMVFSRMQPVTYASTVTLLLSGGGSETTASSIGKFLGLSGISGMSSNNVIVAILKSRRMTGDISRRFELDKKPNFRYSLKTGEAIAGLSVTVEASDPVLSEKIANFAIENLEKLNTDLDITPNRQVVKVLDSATYGRRQPGQTMRRIFVAGMSAFLLVSLYAFFSDYLKKLRQPTSVKP